MRYHCNECDHRWIDNELSLDSDELKCPECSSDDIEEDEDESA